MHRYALVALLGDDESGKIVPEGAPASAWHRRPPVPIHGERGLLVLELTAIVAIMLLVLREFAALGSSAREQRVTRLLGWAAVPFVFAFVALFTSRVLGYLASG